MKPTKGCYHVNFDAKKYTCIFSAKCDIIVSTLKDKTDTGCKQLQEPAQNPLVREKSSIF